MQVRYLFATGRAIRDRDVSLRSANTPRVKRFHSFNVSDYASEDTTTCITAL